MRNLSTLLFVLAFAVQATNAQPNWQWANAFGQGEDPGMQSTYFENVATDSEGNCYVVGCFDGNIMGDITFNDEDPAEQLTGLLVKFNSAGEYLWHKQIYTDDGTQYTKVRIDGVATDSNGDVYITGFFCGTANIGSGISITSTAPGTHSMFIVKYSAIDGTPLWADEAAGTDASYGYNLAIDSSDDVYVTGSFKGTADFSGTQLTSTGDYDGFVAKYSSGGIFQWVDKVGDTSYDSGYSIAIDNNDNIFIIGKFNGAPTIGATTLAPGTNDMFVAKCSDDGAWQNAIAFYCTDNYGFGYIHDIGCDANGNVFVTGPFNTDIDFGNGAEPYTTYPGYLARYGNSLDYQWHKIMASDEDDPDNGTFALKTDVANNVIVTGSLYGTIDFGSGITITENGYSHQAPYIAKFNNAGEIQYAQVFNNQEGGFGGSGLGIDVVGESVIVAGVFDNPITIGNITITCPNKFIWVASGIDPLSSENDILTFDFVSIDEISINIDDINKTVGVVVPEGTNVSSLTSEITVSAGATISPESGIPQDFTNPFEYTVTAENGDDQIWTVTVSIAVSINEINNQVSIYPNPSNGIFTIENLNGFGNLLGLEITDITGKTVLTQRSLLRCVALPLQIDLSNHPKGIYFLKLYGDDNTLLNPRKIIIH